MKSVSSMKLIAIGLSLIVLLYAAYQVRTGLLLIFVSIIFAVVFTPWVERIQRFHLWKWSPGRGAAILILLGFVLTAAGIFLAFAVPPIANDATQLTNDLPRNLHSLQEKVSRLPFGHLFADRLNENGIRQWIETGIHQAFTVFRGVVSGVTGLLTLVLLIAYFILDGQSAFRWALSMVPGKDRPRLASALRRGAERMQHWLYGQITLMLILGGASALVFGLLHIRYFYALAVFAGLANFVPILGPVATVLFAGAVAALDSWAKVVGVLVFYLVYQQVENAFLTPRIMRSTVDLPGVAVIAALAIGGELAGLLGAVIAVPTAALIATMLDEYVVEKAEPSRETKLAA